MALIQEWVCDNSDLNKYGEKLGYNWNHVCDLISKCGIYGEDGDGYTWVYHSSTGEGCSDVDMQKIIDYMLDSLGITDCKVLDN